MHYTLLILLVPYFCFSQKMMVEASKVSFFSAAPLEDIAASSNKLEGIVDFDTGNFFFRIPITSFIFPSSLMQKHFNEKYMESDIYSLSSFKGNFSNQLVISDDQEVSVDAKGILNMHGIERDININTALKIKATTLPRNKLIIFFIISLIYC